MKKICIAADHAGFELKNSILEHFRSYEIVDLGTYSSESVDYPEYAKKVAEYLGDNTGDYGILICGTGIGVSIAANRYPHIRAALCRDHFDAKLSRAHNNANVLVLGARTNGFEDVIKMIDTFLSTDFEGGRHERRVKKINEVNMQTNKEEFYSSTLKNTDPDIQHVIEQEFSRQQNSIELIASENIVSKAVLEVQGSILTNKYAEGYPGKRYYCGCEFVDIAENLAIERVKELFSVKFANVQPHSGSQANQAVFLALLNPHDKVLGMSLDGGGHLTHGSKVNMSGKWFESHFYTVSPETGYIDMKEVERIAIEVKPKMIIAGGSAYPRRIDFAEFRRIADLVGAYLMVDMAHFSGLVAGGEFPSPVELAHVITSTTHKTLRGPRGGVVLTNDEEIAKKINSAVFPGLQGGPLMHVIAAKAVAFKEALSPEYKDYIKHVILNAKTMADTLVSRGYTIFTGGTDCHLLLVDLRTQGLTGAAACKALERAGLTCNKNSIPFDTEKPFITSGIRLGSPAATSRGFKQKEFATVGNLIADVLDGLKKNGAENNMAVEKIALERVNELCRAFPIYS
ncbi:MAG: ribose 5-phosphate isomerase B [Alphaproteobacteria bacterium]